MRTVAKKVSEFEESFVVAAVDFSPDGTRLATNAMVDGLDVHIWDVAGKPHLERSLHKTAPAGAGNALRYNASGSLLAVGHTRDTEENKFGLIRLWDPHTGVLVHDIAEPAGASDQMDFVFTHDDKYFLRTVDRAPLLAPYFVVQRTDTWETIWGLDTRPLSFLPRALALSPDGNFVALGGQVLVYGIGNGYYPRIIIVDLQTRQIVRTIERPFPDGNAIQKIEFSPDGKSLAAAAVVGGSYPGPNAVKIFDPATGVEKVVEATNSAYVYGLDYSPDGKYLVEGWIEDHVRIWDGQHTQLLQTIRVDSSFDCVVRISRDSRTLAIAVGRKVTIWQLQ